jgi:hypothetical protein
MQPGDGKPPIHPIGRWYATILTGLATANEQSVPGNPSSTTVELRKAQEREKDHAQTLDEAVRAPLPKHIWSALDPFLELPDEVSAYEKSRVQICMYGSS